MLLRRCSRIPGAHYLCIRYVTTITSLLLVCALHVATVYAYILVRGKNRRPIIILLLLVALLVSNVISGERVFLADAHILHRLP